MTFHSGHVDIFGEDKQFSMANELAPGHEREVTVTTAGDAEPEAQIATRSAAPAGS